MIAPPELRALRDVLAGIVGALGMAAVIGFAQWLDAEDLAAFERARREAQAAAARQALDAARAEAARAGYQDGLDRIRCRGGWRVDALTGRAIDLDRLQ